MENIEVNLRLTVTQVNTILKYLGSGSYVEVVDLINEIRMQAVPQLAQDTEPPMAVPE